MTWQSASLVILGIALLAGFAWYERSRPPAKTVALVAALAALAVVGRIAFAPLPNVKPTTDIVLIAGYALGGGPGFAVGSITALVSNLFFSHGPWTPWQMAAWGGVGVGGAAFARLMRGREPGRLALAAACAGAGIAFGAFMDVYQWSLAARQTPASYLAISGTSFPYNVAHVVGNVIFSLLIGLPLLRSLRRYRERFEARWAAPAVAAAFVALLALPGLAAASPGSDARSYLKSAQNADGGLGGARGDSSSTLYTSWAALGLAATGENPQDVARGSKSLTDYLKSRAGSINDVPELERTILVAVASGMNPENFAGRDLVKALKRERDSDGSYGGLVNQTAFAILALDAANSPSGLQESARWLMAHQGGDGGFSYNPSGRHSDVDVTAVVLQAFASTRDHRSPSAKAAVNFLRAAQNRDGGFGQTGDSASNAQSTAFAVQGLDAVDENPAHFGRRDPISYLRSLQQSDGSVRYSRSSSRTPVWVTSQAALAYEEKAFPLTPIARDPTADHGGGNPDEGTDTGTSGEGSTSGDTSTDTGGSTDTDTDTATGGTSPGGTTGGLSGDQLAQLNSSPGGGGAGLRGGDIPGPGGKGAPVGGGKDGGAGAADVPAAFRFSAMTPTPGIAAAIVPAVPGLSMPAPFRFAAMTAAGGTPDLELPPAAGPGAPVAEAKEGSPYAAAVVAGLTLMFIGLLRLLLRRRLAGRGGMATGRPSIAPAS